MYDLEKNIQILAIIASIAPMFGFLGTIIGVIKIFYDISLTSDVSIGTVSAGLYTKMVTSAAGPINERHHVFSHAILHHHFHITQSKHDQGLIAQFRKQPVNS